MSRCAFPLIVFLFAIPFKPPSFTPELPPFPPIPGANIRIPPNGIPPSLPGLPGRPTITFSLAIPFKPPSFIPKLPSLPPIPKLNLPGRPSIIYKLAIPGVPKIELPPFPPKFSYPVCPLDKVAK